MNIKNKGKEDLFSRLLGLLELRLQPFAHRLKNMFDECRKSMSKNYGNVL
jgi:hypothetical protein